MNIKIVCVGKLKERYWLDAQGEYSKRLSKYCSLTLLEIKEERLPDNASFADEEKVKIAEGQRILNSIKGDNYIIALDLLGHKLSSEKLSEKIAMLGLEGKSDISFIIGGSLGISQEVLSKAHYILSFSDMTFPHQLMRIILLEQIYRGFKILKNEAYHK